ncbi:39221_t:CDS:2 [Gigaspora margarita]|uniref:39221_t:CDS:1 n=1 Tax=Gigaspora margarita TaxID=4874 RepID=A0ABN7UA49_GIGMA|nr:39221_t:CDS:2 [Gigaspora margarita]
MVRLNKIESKSEQLSKEIMPAKVISCQIKEGKLITQLEDGREVSGKIEPNETPLEAAKREVFEETNLIIEDLEIVAEKVFFSDELLKNKTGYLIKANKYSGEIKIKELEKIADIQFKRIDYDFAINVIFFNGNITTGFKSPQKLLNDLAEIKKVSKSDLKAFLTQDHTSFSVLSVSTKHIESTNRISVTLSKNSAQSFYLGEPKISSSNPLKEPKIIDDCLQDAQNCTYFAFFSSKEKKLHTRFKDKIESNFEGTEAQQPSLFLTLTFNTTHDNYAAFTTN